MPAHPPIHNHGFNLHSLVLAGEYREARFEVSMSQNVHKNGTNIQKPMLTYMVKSDGQNNEDLIILSGEKLYASAKLGVERYGPGETHSIPIGEYHATLIPKNRFCATIAVMGPRQEKFVDRLLGRASFDPSKRVRESISPDDTRLLIDSLFSEAECA